MDNTATAFLTCHSLCLLDELVGLVPVLYQHTARDIVKTNVEILELLGVEIVNLLCDIEYVLDSVCARKTIIMVSNIGNKLIINSTTSIKLTGSNTL